MKQTVDIWVDPACPWAWLTTRWLLEAATVRELDVRFHVMSLAVLNENKELSPEYQTWLERAYRPVRVLIATEKRHGHPAVQALYGAMGRRRHVEGMSDFDEIIIEALQEVGFEADLAEVANETAFDEALRESHALAMSLVGDDVGTPVLKIGAAATFGPIVSPAPRGEAAGQLFDAVATVISTPGFFELKRTRNQEPRFD